MKKLPYIRESKRFYGKFELVVDDGYVIPCHNLATACSIKKRITESNNGNKKT